LVAFLVALRFGNDPHEIARFQREAQVLASMEHPGIAAIHGLEDCNGIQVYWPWNVADLSKT